MKTTQPTIGVETITPERAAEYLVQTRKNNRPISATSVNAYAEAMKRGEWLLGPDAIAFDTNGELLNGHHRLRACVLAHVAFPSTVFRGIEPAAFDVTDDGRKRTQADILNSHGHKDGSILAASIRLVLAYRAGTIVNPGATKGIATKPLVVAEADRSTGLWNEATRIGRQSAPFNPSAIAAFVVIATEEGDYELEEITAFVDKIVTGEGLAKGDPRLALRNWRMRALRPIALETLANVVKSWNHWTDGRELDHLKAWHRGRPYPTMKPATAE